MKINNYRTTFDFFYTQNDEIINVPKGTILYVSDLVTPNPKSLLSYIAVHYNIKDRVIIPSAFIEKNKNFFDEITRDEVDEYLHFLCAIDLLLSSKMDKSVMVEELSKALGFFAMTESDIDNLWNPEDEIEDGEYLIGKAPLTRFTWSSTGPHTKIEYND